LNGMTKALLKEPEFKKRGALFEHVHEDMSVMTDAELQVFCGTYKVPLRFKSCWHICSHIFCSHCASTSRTRSATWTLERYKCSSSS
jgi:hypothetical protein